MHTSALNGHEQVVQLLLSVGCDPLIQDNKGSFPMHEAATGGHLQSMAGTDLSVRDACNCVPLHYAASGGHVAAVRWLLEVNAYYS